MTKIKNYNIGYAESIDSSYPQTYAGSIVNKMIGGKLPPTVEDPSRNV